MPVVRIAENKIWVDEAAIALIGGEVHYWRLNPSNWKPVLERVRALGIQVVATYVCWDFHQIGPGQYDFTGATDPQRNLVGFLDLLTQEGFWIILRPGPYIYSEWKNGGVPDEAACYHRLSDEFHQLARHYMQAVFEVAAPYLATRGGRIILWQADNEIDPWPHWYTEPLGLGQTPGPFHDYLRERYAAVEALNAAWETTYTAFEQARAVTSLQPNDPDLLRRHLDFAGFQHWYVNRVAEWSVNTYRELGVDVPVYLNAYSGVGTQVWADLEKLCDLAGPDIYPSREFALRPNEHRGLLEAVRYTRTYSRLPYIPEFESGIWHDWLGDVGTLTPAHYRLMCLSALMAGTAGWNWYMLVNRDNWYQSPINEWGRTRPELFDAFKQIMDLFWQVDPTTLVKLTNTAVTFDPLQRATVRPGQDLLQAFYQADIDYEFLDLANPESRAFDKPILFYAGGAWLSGASQARCDAYIRAGGHLVLVGAVPKLDEHLHPLNTLNAALPDGVIQGLPNLRIELWDGVITSPWIYQYNQVPGEPIRARRLSEPSLISEENRLQTELQANQTYTIGYTESRGPGRLTVIGALPTPGLLAALHAHFDVPIPTRSITPGVNTALFRRGEALYLLAANPGSEDKVADIRLDGALFEGQGWQAQDLISGEARALSVGKTARVQVALPRKDGRIVRMSRMTPG